MDCPFCGVGELAPAEIEYATRDAEDRWIIVQGVPAMVCDVCGERTFSPSTVESLHALMGSRKAPLTFIQVAVHEFEEVEREVEAVRHGSAAGGL